jgi:pilus assembly protein Flp/PilA
MNNALLKLCFKFQDLLNTEEGQDLIEYGLVVALIAFGATASMKGLSSGINSAFSKISAALATNVT